LGKAIKEKKFLRSSVLIVLPLAVLLAIAYIRKNYLVGIHAKISPEAGLWIYWLIGVLLFTVATMISLSQHEGRPDVQTVLKNIGDTQKKLKMIEHKMETLQREANFWAEKVVKIDTDRVGFFRKKYSELQQYTESGKAMINVYRRQLLEKYLKYKKPETEQPKPPRAYLLKEKGILGEGNPEKLDRVCNHQKEEQAS